MLESAGRMLTQSLHLILTPGPLGGHLHHAHVTHKETDMHGGSGSCPRSPLASSISKIQTPDPSDCTAGPLNSCTWPPFSHISTQEIFTYRLIGSLRTLMLPRLSPCMSACFSQMATLLKNILIILCNNLSSGDGDLQTADCLEGG